MNVFNLMALNVPLKDNSILILNSFYILFVLALFLVIAVEQSIKLFIKARNA